MTRGELPPDPFDGMMMRQYDLDDPDVDHMIEVREICVGLSVAVLKDGTAVNLWNPDTWPFRYVKVQDWIDHVWDGELFAQEQNAEAG